MTRYGNAEVGEGCRGINVCTTCVHSHLVVVKLSLKMAYFVEEKGWLFAGDAYVHAKVPVALVVEDYIKTLHSCKKLAALPGLGPLFCAHRPQPDAVEAFGKKTEYKKDEYVSRVRALHQQGLSELEIGMKATSFSPFMWAYTLGTG